MTGIEARSSSMPTGAKRGCIDQDAACPKASSSRVPAGRKTGRMPAPPERRVSQEANERNGDEGHPLIGEDLQVPDVVDPEE